MTATTRRTVLKGARYPGDVAISGGQIEAVGTVAQQRGDHIVDCGDAIITPGLVNTHHHLYQWLTRGRASGCDLFTWLKELYPIWALIEPADVGAAALRGIAELALSGVTTVFDHHYVVPSGDDSVFDAIAAARAAVGVRLYLSRGSMDLGESDGGLPPDNLVEKTDAILSSTEEIASRLGSEELVDIVVGPCSPFSVTSQLMSESADLARRLGLRLHTHLAESIEEEADSLERFGCRPLDYVESLGWQGADVWYAHGVHLNDDEVARIGAARSGVAHCPSSNGRLGAGICPVRGLLDAGAPVGLGVDGPASNEQGELFSEIRQALYQARLRHGRATDLTAAEALALATAGGAACLGRDDIGRIEAGMRADLAIWPAFDIADIEDPVAGLVLGPHRKVVGLFVDGAEIVAEGRLVHLDLEMATEDLTRRAKRLWS